MTMPLRLLLTLFFTCLFPASALAVDLSLESSTLLSTASQATLNHRLRLQASKGLTPNALARLVLDQQSHWQEGGPLTSKPRLHRAVLELEQGAHLLLLGRQRVPFGVGRLWNPVDRFNPIDIQSPEPEEREGSDTLRYEYAGSALSGLDLTLGKRRQAIRFTSFQAGFDLGLIGLRDQRQRSNLLGWELAGALGETDLELRSEGALARSWDHSGRQTSWLLGLDTPLSSSLSLLAEWHHDPVRGDELGALLNYLPEAFWNASLLVLVSLEDGSLFFSPSLHHSLSDDQTLELNVQFSQGGKEDVYHEDPRLFLRWAVYF